MFAKEGYSTMTLTVVIAVAMALLGVWLGSPWSYILNVLALLLLGIIFYFFRDPDRVSPEEANVILAPADGKIVEVKEVNEPVYMKGNVKQISIFLSLFDVHVNRHPASGEVKYVRYHPGKYLMAWNPKASELNERADFGILHPSGIKIFFRQITGFVARRIVYDVDKGEQVSQGERFGMMKFGSRMDVLLPDQVEITARKGDTTRGGETILGRIKT